MAITIIDITIVPISMIQISIIQQSMMSTTLPNTFFKCLPLLLTLLLFMPSQSTVKNFGMNKPHFLFHLGDRRPISTNIGWGYWSDSSPLRMKYANTQDQLYAHMTVHDGQNFFMEKVEDRRSDLVSDIRYQSNEQSWEVQIEMHNKGSNLTTWFMYYSVENNDYKLIDHQKHTSYIYLVPQKATESKFRISTKVLSYAFPNQTFSLSQTIAQENDDVLSQANNIKLFGLTANISQTYAVLQIAETFKHLVKVSRGQESIQERESDMPAKDKKILDWQNKQVEFIKEDKWEDKSYVVLFLYGVVSKGQNCKIYLTNSTTSKQFNHKQFKDRQAKLQQEYFPTPQPKYHDFLKHTISNLYAGLTFYYGRLYTQNSLTVHRQDYSYSFTPSRLIFPRSFLWDDGFHQSVIVHYNPYIIIDVLNNWMNKVDIFGWIGREQIRGGEISSMMPDSRFVFQDWFQMNPPTLIMSIQSLLQKSRQQKKLSDQVKIFLMNNFHKLELWYRYFKNTQSHQSLQYPETMNITDRFYRWHCKDECSKGNFMGSGLDDYPRRNQQSEIAKQHVDLVSWLYFFADGLEKIGKFLEQVEQKQIMDKGQQRIRNKYTRRVRYYQKQVEEYLHSLYQSFYDKDDFLFKDIVVVRSDLFIERFVNKIGYINLFPFFTGMLSQLNGLSNYEDKRVKSLKKCLQIMSDEKLLLSEDGLRSLSFSDPLYGTDDNYWRGAVWLPINYMVLRACKKYYWNDSKLSKQIQELYVQLRQRLINSVHNTYKETGYLYQNYYEGRGHRGYPFYGWTSTIVNIITEQY